MKKSELKQLIRECLAESNMSRLHLEISEAIQQLIEKGATVEMIQDVLEQTEFHNEKGQVDPNGSFDAGGHMVRHPAMMREGEHNNQLYIRATGRNRYAGGSGGRWLKIRRIEDQGKDYAVFIHNEGMEKVFMISKEELKQDHVPNVAFRIRSMPASARMVINHYFSNPQ